MVSPSLPEDAKVAAVRQALPATGAGIFLDTGTAGPLSRETARAMDDLAGYELAVGRSSVDREPEIRQRMAEARAAIAAILTTDVESVALTHSTTEGLNVCAWGLDWQPGDRIVTSSLEHPAGRALLMAIAERRGLDVETVDIGRGGDDEATIAAFDRALSRGARLVLLSHVCWNTGAVLPVRAIADIAHRRGAMVVVDGAQAAGAIPVDVAALDADAYALPARKWLLGPEGMGALWIDPAVGDRIQPTFAGALGFEPDETRPPRRWPDARRFEHSIFHAPSVVGFARSCGWLAMFVGLEWIYARGAALARRTTAALAAIPGVELVTPTGQMAGLVTFRIDGWPADLALDELARRAFVLARSLPGADWLRFSVGFFNTEEELDRTVEVVGEIARHRPETMPRRPALTILGEG